MLLISSILICSLAVSFFLPLFPLWVLETCSVFHYQWKKWGERLKKVSPISINTQVLVENESKLRKIGPTGPSKSHHISASSSILVVTFTSA